MAVNTKFNVKVPLNVSGSETPGQNMAVYWNEGSGSFELTASLGGGGNQNLQSVTEFGNSSSLGGLFLSGASLNYGAQTSINATSGFISSSSGGAFTHITPQTHRKDQLILTVPARRLGGNAGYAPKPYPDNYITYGGILLGEDEEDGDKVEICSPKFRNTSLTDSPLFAFNTVQVGHTISVLCATISDLEPSVNDTFVLRGYNNPEYIVFMTCATVDCGDGGEVTFTVTSLQIPNTGGSPQPIQQAVCISFSDRRSRGLIITGEGFDAGGGVQPGVAQIELRGSSGSAQSSGEGGGMLLSSAGNIYFFNPVTASVSGSLSPTSASAQISLRSDNSLQFSTRDPLINPTSSSFKTSLVISSSGTEPRVSIGFNPNEIPEKPFEIKTDKDDATGTELVLEGSRKTTPYVAGDELGKISFLAASSSFSGSERFTKGEGAVIRSAVSTQAKEGIKGELTFAIADNVELEPTASFKMQINGGVSGIGANNGINLVQSGSLVLTDRISGSTREIGGLFLGDASGSQTFRVTNSGSNTSYDDAELVLTGSAIISGSHTVTSVVTADSYDVADGKGIGLANNYSGVTFNDGGNLTIGFGGSWTMDVNKDNGVTLYELGYLGLYRDFRIEGDSDTHLFFVTGGDSRIGIGTSTPSSKLDVSGDIKTNTISTIETTLGSDSATNVDTFATATYKGATYDYILYDASVGARMGHFMVIQDNSNIEFTDTSTPTLGSESSIPSITADISGDNVRVRVTNGNGYTFKAFTKKL